MPPYILIFVSCVTRHARAYLKIPLIIYASNSWTQIHRGPHLREKKGKKFEVQFQQHVVYAQRDIW